MNGPDYSIWDWKLGKYRYYRSPSPEGLFDPEVPHLPHSPQQLGFAVEHCLATLPFGSQFLGTGERALGRVACDATSRAQASAKLPEGIGSLGGTGGMGGMGIIPFVPFLGLGELNPSSWLTRLRPLIPIALAFAAGVLILKGMKKPRRARRANLKLRPGQIWRRGSGELWKACERCGEAVGPFETEGALRAGQCKACKRAVAFDDEVTGRFQRPVAIVKASKSMRVR